MEKPRTPQILTFKDAAAWEEWLAGHHTLHEGVMIQMAKKDSGIPSVTHLEALDVALCYGWIDGIRRGLDETYFLQKFTPRRPRSLWSTINIGKVEALMAAGRMKEPGLAAMKAAKADGRWAAAYSGQKTATVPPELAAALQANKKAKAFYDTLDKANRYAAIFRVATARTPEIRKSRLQKIIAQLEAGQKFH